MSRDGCAAQLLRFLGIVFMGVTVLFTLLGGAGTLCVAFGAQRYGDSMALLAPYQWLYQLLTFVSLAMGVWGLWAELGLILGTRPSYRNALIVLIGGGGAALAQIIASRLLRGGSMPTDIRFYITLVTLALFLSFRLPGLRQAVDYDQGAASVDGVGPTGAVSAFIAGVMMLTVPYWAGPTHTWEGVNYADAWHLPLTAGGVALILIGLGGLVWTMAWVRVAFRRKAALRPVAG